MPKYQRIVLKVSGEALAGGASFGIDTARVNSLAAELAEVAKTGVQITACGACLAFFHILDKQEVGEVTNMLEIVTGMQLADTVITI